MKLGDLVAEGIHHITGIDPCGGCNQRREWLNDFGDSVVDLLRRDGKLKAMSYQVTVNTQRQYVVEAESDEDALAKIASMKPVFVATTNNIRLLPTTPAQPAQPATPAVPA